LRKEKLFLALGLLLALASIQLPTVQAASKTITWERYEFSVTVEYPDQAYPGQAFPVSVEITATRYDIYFTAYVTLLYGEGVITDRIKVIDEQRLAPGMTAKGTADFVLEQDIRSGTVYMLIEVEFLDGDTKETILGLDYPADVFTVVAGPYIEAGDIEQLRSQYQALQQQYQSLEQQYQDLQNSYQQLEQQYQSLEQSVEQMQQQHQQEMMRLGRELETTRIMVYGFGATTVVLALVLVLLGMAKKGIKPLMR